MESNFHHTQMLLFLSLFPSWSSITVKKHFFKDHAFDDNSLRNTILLARLKEVLSVLLLYLLSARKHCWGYKAESPAFPSTVPPHTPQWPTWSTFCYLPLSATAYSGHLPSSFLASLNSLLMVPQSVAYQVSTFIPFLLLRKLEICKGFRDASYSCLKLG